MVCILNKLHRYSIQTETVSTIRLVSSQPQFLSSLVYHLAFHISGNMRVYNVCSLLHHILWCPVKDVKTIKIVQSYINTSFPLSVFQMALFHSQKTMAWGILDVEGSTLEGSTLEAKRRAANHNPLLCSAKTGKLDSLHISPTTHNTILIGCVE